ncbi:MAG: phage antirepressor KilAC domain-containing protein [Lachnospiraceae bacterium]|nr:phage antirepressor KilAC domain-containing protein [Lachnospiraceae bacterium]
MVKGVRRDMDGLIAINYDGRQPTVSGRELHAALGIMTRYNDWFARMCEFGFVEGKDYYSILSNRSDGLPGKPRNDHEMALSMAKEICMLQRSEAGRRFRQYFIEVEEAWNKPELVMARALQLAQKTVEQLIQEKTALLAQVEAGEQQIGRMLPKVRYVDYVLQSPSLVLVTQIAKDYGMSAVALNWKLNSMGIQYRVGTQWVLYARYQDRGYTHSRTILIPKENGLTETKMQTEWTQRGRLFLYGKLKEEGILPMIERGGEEDAGGSE